MSVLPEGNSKSYEQILKVFLVQEGSDFIH